MNSFTEFGPSFDSNFDFDLVYKSVYHLFHKEYDSEHYSMFLYKFRQIIWFSYRKNFQPILRINNNAKRKRTESRDLMDVFQDFKTEFRTMRTNSKLTFTTDEGWGCMLRCAQMMLAQTMIKMDPCHEHEEIINDFLDSEDRTFSIHQMVLSGNRFGKIPGEWYGPSTVAHVLKERVKNSELGYHLEIKVIDQGVIYETDISYANQLIIIPLRLGIDSINGEYYDTIKSFLKFPSSVGILGGTPNHALYIVGSVDKPDSILETHKLICLDPHTIQNTVISQRPINIETFSCSEPKVVSTSNLDPSLALGFYLRNKDDFMEFKDSIERDSSKLITIESHKPKWLKKGESKTFSDFELI